MTKDLIKSIIESIPAETSFFFYSSLFQGNAALVTLTAMFVIYKKQGFDSSIARLERIIIDYLTSTCKISINYGNIHELEVYKDEMGKDLDDSVKEKLKELTTSTQWKNRFQELREFREEFNSFINDAEKPTMNIFILLIASIILLPLSGIIHQNALVELTLFIIVIVFQTISLISLFRFIKQRFKQVS